MSQGRSMPTDGHQHSWWHGRTFSMGKLMQEGTWASMLFIQALSGGQFKVLPGISVVDKLHPCSQIRTQTMNGSH